MTVPTPAGYVVAADVGGTLTKVAQAYGDKTTSPATRFPTQRENGRVSVSWLATTLRDAIDPRLSERCMGVAVAVPGIVDVAAGTVLAAPNLGWVDLPLRDQLGALTGHRVLLGQDVRAGGIAEFRRGAGAETDTVLFVALGTGVAAAIFAHGKLVHAGGYAGKIGHVRVAAAADTECACGQGGCLETVASASWVARRYAALSGRAVSALGGSPHVVVRATPTRKPCSP